MIKNSKILLHICCAPDATVPLEEFLVPNNGVDVVGYFYGANIHPNEEYIRRRDALEKLASHFSIPCIYDDLDPDGWFAHTQNFAEEPEGGKRCEICFRLQLESAARAAKESGCSHLCTTLTISPHKNAALINKIGDEIAHKNSLVWIEKIWRKNDGFLRSIKMAKELSLFRQNYCGCTYSTP